MEKNKKTKRDPLPEEFNSLEEAGEFWDTHSSADYEEYMKEVDFDVELKRRAHDVRVTDDVLREIRKIARQRGVATETLINLWLQEKVAAAVRRSA
jgi:predicted DNA binding CopG/RHH family protein